MRQPLFMIFIRCKVSLIFTVAIVLECCIQLGLIPTNTDYGKLFRQFSINAQITDKNGVPVYSSKPAQLAEKQGARLSVESDERFSLILQILICWARRARKLEFSSLSFAKQFGGCRVEFEVEGGTPTPD